MKNELDKLSKEELIQELNKSNELVNKLFEENQVLRNENYSFLRKIVMYQENHIMNMQQGKQV